MIHTFESCGKKMALDVGSGAVHALDDLSYDALRLYSEGTALDAVSAALEGKYKFDSAQIEMVPQNYVKITSEDDVKKFEKMIDLLEDDDVQNVWHNWEE